ncbi:hypothetical protein [Kibdelosporangium aridum]|uniref:hypothetical protein n=1 Tax=Kibdelosporangium aridum TaxID=2030 RepID=UPI0005252F53
MNWSALASLITAVTAIGALVFTGLSLNATRDQVAVAQARHAVAEQGQFTERYSRAIDQLGRQGAEHLQVRLGGIYALERLVRGSPRDQPTIVEVLAAFIDSTALPKIAPTGLMPVAPEGSPGEVCPNQTSTADIQAALTVIGRRNPTMTVTRRSTYTTRAWATFACPTPISPA